MQVIGVKCLNDYDPIVIVDDSESDLFIASHVYKRSELKNPLLTFDSGEAFLDYMQKVKLGDLTVPTMVLMDINMPGGMNGFETIEALRKCHEFIKIPIVVMLTHSNSIDDVERSVLAGANGFQTKDFSTDNYVLFFNSLKADSQS